ncbi:hypothetical protein OGATHE_006394 [Ogataea polymorpha]|uniref:Uncharacterized protein n=1 Tax=Ogataea polymorpha TaxID=460523 RepID=A0A9P8SY79_9ASCO|nr:hypothetical protein OGATHE_006394 [Ogataea polymorpha]
MALSKDSLTLTVPRGGLLQGVSGMVLNLEAKVMDFLLCSPVESKAVCRGFTDLKDAGVTNPFVFFGVKYGFKNGDGEFGDDTSPPVGLKFSDSSSLRSLGEDVGSLCRECVVLRDVFALPEGLVTSVPKSRSLMDLVISCSFCSCFRGLVSMDRFKTPALLRRAAFFVANGGEGFLKVLRSNSRLFLFEGLSVFSIEDLSLSDS